MSQEGRALIAIQSSHLHRDWQASQRETWIRDIPGGVDYRFFLGNPVAGDASADEVFLDIPDDYGSTCFKMRGIAEWALAGGYQHVYKIDMDTLVNVGNLLGSGFREHDYTGGLYKHPRGLLFASGGSGYWLSERALRLVAAEPTWEGQLNDNHSGEGGHSDVWVAMIMERNGIPLHDDRRYKFLPGERLEVSTIALHLGSVFGWAGSVPPYSPSLMYEGYRQMRALGSATAIGCRLMGEDELLWLAEQATRRLAIANIGAWTGASVRALAEASLGTVFAIDSWWSTHWEEEFCAKNFNVDLKSKPPDWIFTTFLKGMEPLTNIVTMRMLSTEAAPRLRGIRLDMVYIDANHCYEKVREDILAWRPLLCPGGLLCGHDYCDAVWGRGVMRAVDELLPGFRRGPSSIWYYLDKEGQ